MIPSFPTHRPGQTVQTQISLFRVYPVCNSLCILWMLYSKIKPPYSPFRVITTYFLGVRIFRNFTVATKISSFTLSFQNKPCFVGSLAIWAQQEYEPCHKKMCFSGGSDQVRLKLACSATEARMRLEILVTETRDITLTRQQKQRHWSDCIDVQVDLPLCCSHVT